MSSINIVKDYSIDHYKNIIFYRMPDITSGFDEAYIRTWSQPILHADSVPFRITFTAHDAQSQV